MEALIYRNSDKLVVAIVSSRRTPEQFEAAVAAELNNILVSELKGVRSDYGTIRAETVVSPGQKTVVSPAGVLEFIRLPSPEEIDAANLRALTDAATVLTAEIDKAFVARGLPTLTPTEKAAITVGQLNVAAKAQGR